MRKILAWLFLPASLIFIFVIVIGGYPSDNKIIKTGFNKRLVKSLEERYELRIPSNAVFISGHYEFTLQDPSIYITFKIPESELSDLFVNNWKAGWAGSDEKKYFSSFEYQKEQFTGLSCYDKVDGYITIDFKGNKPKYPN